MNLGQGARDAREERVQAGAGVPGAGVGLPRALHRQRGAPLDNIMKYNIA